MDDLKFYLNYLPLRQFVQNDWLTNISYRNVLIDLVQKKTGKAVTVPVASKHLKEMVLNDLPYSISQQNLNEFIKKVCELSGIDQPIKGRVLDAKTNRKVKGVFPKYDLITSHSFRRSFATNYYKKIATPVLMTITGHSKESMFLNYINQQEDKDENALLFLRYYEALNSKE
jgi:integrase